MPKVKEKSTGKKINCNDSNFVFKGGEGAVYIINEIAYKLCNEPGNMIPDLKIEELSKLKHDRIIVPTDILLGSKDTKVGYSMKAVPGNPMPLAQILTKGYREREGVSPETMFDLIKQIADGLNYIHKSGPSNGSYLQVDGNDHNYMVTEDHKEVYFIDSNSFQTPSFPADAIQARIRDWQVKKEKGKWKWNTLSDAYSFAIVSFYMFTGIHPFGGVHPHCTDRKIMITENMKHNKSVLDPDTKYPKGAVYYPFENVIPSKWMKWYESLFVKGERLPIPGTDEVVIVFAPVIREFKETTHFKIVEIKDFSNPVIQYVDVNGNFIAVTKKHVFTNKGLVQKPGGKKFRVGFTSENTPVGAWIDDDKKVKIINLNKDKIIDTEFCGNSLSSCEGRIYVLGQDDILEIDYIENSEKIIPVGRPVAQIMPNATELFQGVAVQNMMGATMVSIFPGSLLHKQFKIAELQNYRITAAKYENRVMMVIALHKQTGNYNRFVFRFSYDFNTYDCRVVEDITPVDINFTVNDKGVCVCINESEKLEVFSNRKGHEKVDIRDAEAISASMKLCHSGSQIRFAHGNKIHSFSMK